MDIDRHARNARAAIGVVPQELNIDPYFTPLELPEYASGYVRLATVMRNALCAPLERVGLEDKTTRLCPSFIRGDASTIDGGQGDDFMIRRFWSLMNLLPGLMLICGVNFAANVRGVERPRCDHSLDHPLSGGGSGIM